MPASKSCALRDQMARMGVIACVLLSLFAFSGLAWADDAADAQGAPVTPSQSEEPAAPEVVDEHATAGQGAPEQAPVSPDPTVPGAVQTPQEGQEVTAPEAGTAGEQEAVPARADGEEAPQTSTDDANPESQSAPATEGEEQVLTPPLDCETSEQANAAAEAAGAGETEPTTPAEPETPEEPEEPEQPKPTLPVNNCAFESGLSYGFVFDVKGGKTDNKTNIQLHRSNDTKAQRFKLEKHGNGYYIVSVSSGKVLDVAGGKIKKGTNVWLYKKNGSKAQLWVPELMDNGGWVLRSLLGGNLVLDVAGGKTANGTNLQVWTYNGSKAQTFYFREVNPALGEGQRLIEDGTYLLSVSKDTSMSLQVAGGSTTKGANIELGKGDEGNDQRFYATYANGFYTLQSVLSGMALEVAQGSPVARANVRLWNANHTPAQQWMLKSAGEGLYTLVNRGTGLVLEISGGKTAAGTNVWGYYANGTTSQAWAIERTSLVADGFYTLTDAETGKVLDVTSGSFADGARLQRYKSNGSIAQKFYVESSDTDDSCHIRSANSASYLTANGTNVVQSKAQGVDRAWRLAWNGSGITLMHDGKAMGFDSANKATLVNKSAGATLDLRTTTLFAPGYYQIKSLVGTVLDVKDHSTKTANAVTSAASADSSQVWRVWADKGAYVLTNIHSGMALELVSTSSANGVKVRQGTYAGAKQQLWKIVWNEEQGGLRFVNVLTNKSLDVANDATAAGTTVQQGAPDASKGQSWRVTSKMTVALKEHVAQVAEHFAEHNAHGYSQPNRGAGPKETITLRDGAKAVVSSWDLDCSEFVRQCINQFFTGDDLIDYLDTRCEDAVLKAHGFERIKYSASDVQRGDVLWMSGHTAIALGDGKQAEAAVDENNSIFGPTRGDQTGKEVAVNNLYKSWTYIYRYMG